MRNLILFSLLACAAPGQTLVQNKLCTMTFIAGSPGHCAFSSPTSNSNQVVVGVSQAGAAWSGTLTDSGGNTYTQEKSQASTAGTRTAQIWRARTLTADAGTLTFTAPDSGNRFVTVTIYEINGLASGAPDTTSGGNGTTSPFACGTTTTSTANDLLISAFMLNGGAANANITQPTGFTLNQANQNGTTFEQGGFASFALTGTVSAGYTWTTSENADAACAVVAFKLGAATPVVVHRVVSQ